MEYAHRHGQDYSQQYPLRQFRFVGISEISVVKFQNIGKLKGIKKLFPGKITSQTLSRS